MKKTLDKMPNRATTRAYSCYSMLANKNLTQYNPSPNTFSSYHNIKAMQHSLKLESTEIKEFLNEFLSHTNTTIVTSNRRKHKQKRPSKTLGCFIFLFIKEEVLKNAKITTETLINLNKTHGTLAVNFKRAVLELIHRDTQPQMYKLLANYAAGLAFSITKNGGRYPEELDTNFLILSKIDILSQYLKPYEIEKIDQAKKIIEEKTKPALPKIKSSKSPPPGFEPLDSRSSLPMVGTLTFPAPQLLPTTSPIAADKDNKQSAWQTQTNKAWLHSPIRTHKKYGHSTTQHCIQKPNTKGQLLQSLFYTKELNPNTATKSLEPTW